MYTFNLSPVETSPQNPASTNTDDSGIDTSGGRRKSELESCLVCGAPTKGIHFQVLSCRACSAFFRRSVKAKKVYRCRRGNRNCDLNKPPNGKPICRFCRLQKCSAVGMRIDATTVDDPAPVASTIRDSGSSSPEANTEKLSQLQYAFSKLREEVCPQGPIPTAETYNKIVLYPFQEEFARKSAEMMMSCDPFVDLPPEDKWKIFQHSWPLIYHIERQFSSCEIFGYDINDHRSLLTKEIAVDYTKSGVYINGMDPQKLEELMKFCFPLKQAMTDMLHNPIKQLLLTQFEICYIVGLIMFSVHEVKGLSEETKQMGEQIVDQFSTELHNYYVYELKMNNYAARHAKLIRLISCAQQVAISIKDHMMMARVFDIFVTDVYDSELYE
ncbi:hypothetical protein FO519_002451 [Halicephalobus sp. NKZ332]|nr:hypothetical protein FO519_002451 [Halicephalobus sp. NKZ332]